MRSISSIYVCIHESRIRALIHIIIFLSLALHFHSFFLSFFHSLSFSLSVFCVCMYVSIVYVCMYMDLWACYVSPLSVRPGQVGPRTKILSTTLIVLINSEDRRISIVPPKYIYIFFYIYIYIYSVYIYLFIYLYRVLFILFIYICVFTLKYLRTTLKSLLEVATAAGRVTVADVLHLS